MRSAAHVILGHYLCLSLCVGVYLLLLLTFAARRRWFVAPFEGSLCGEEGFGHGNQVVRCSRLLLPSPLSLSLSCPEWRCCDRLLPILAGRRVVVLAVARAFPDGGRMVERRHWRPVRHDEGVLICAPSSLSALYDALGYPVVFSGSVEERWCCCYRGSVGGRSGLGAVGGSNKALLGLTVNQSPSQHLYKH